MIGMICIREDLFNGLGSEKSTDQWTSSSRAGHVDLVHPVCLVHLVSFIQPNKPDKPNKQKKPAGSRASYATVCGAGGSQKGFEQSPVEGMPVEKKLRVPLDAEKKAVGRRFDCLHNTIAGQGAGDQRRRDGFDRLMVRTIHPHRPRSHNASKQATGCDGDGVTEIRRWSSLPMLARCRDLRCNILKQTAAAGDIHSLHAATDGKQRDVSPSRQMDDVQFKTRAPFAHDSERIALTFTIQ
jgi:hypothetical protein